MRRGTWVKFSGTFIRAETDCLREGSVTQDGSMRYPEFIFQFTAVQSKGEWQMARIVIKPAPPPPAEIQDIDVSVTLDYVGTDKTATRRRVTIHRATGHQRPNGSIALEDIRGYCHLRQTARTFRLAQISNVVTEDGEIVSDLGAWILSLADPT